MKPKYTYTNKLATSVLAGGMLFSGSAGAANVVANGGFETPNSGWTNQGGNYTHPYGGINGPQLTEVGTLSNYGFNDNLSDSAGTQFHGLSFPTSQVVTLTSGDLTGAQITAGQGRFSFSAWLATCCDDTPKITLEFDDAASTQVVFNRAIATHMQTTADLLVNPGGPNNAASQGVATDASRRYWALYEFKGTIPTDATQASITIDDGRADGGVVGTGNGNDNYVDMVILDTVAQVPEPSSTALLGLGGVALILRRRK